MNASPASPPRLGLAILVLSCGVLGYEISLMRILLYAGWHHFAFLVLSAALLGFGASGTALCLAGRRLEPRGDTAIFVLVLVTAFSIPAASRLAAEIPVEARFLPALLGKQIGAWVLYWAVWFVPFFLGAAAIGLALAVSRARVAAIYGFNLLGSAAGACAAPIAMGLVHPKWLPVIMGSVTLAAALPLRTARSRRGVFWVSLTGAGILIFTVVVPPKIRVDPYKYASYVLDLEKDGRATAAARAYSPRSVVEIYFGDVFHEIAFLSPGKVPPPLLAVTRDGHWAGSVLRVGRAEDAAVVDNTMMAVPYAFAAERPSVLLLGETGGTNVWLAARRGARAVDVVQPDGKMLRVIRGELGSEGGSVFDLPGRRRPRGRTPSLPRTLEGTVRSHSARRARVVGRRSGRARRAPTGPSHDRRGDRRVSRSALTPRDPHRLPRGRDASPGEREDPLDDRGGARETRGRKPGGPRRRGSRLSLFLHHGEDRAVDTRGDRERSPRVR